MARDNGNPQQMFLLVTDDTQSTSVQINSEGQAKLMDPESPKKEEEEEEENGITFYNDKGEVEKGVLLRDYHFFVNENNELFSVPPGSIVQGRFKVTNKHFPTTPETTGAEKSSVKVAEEVPITPDSTTIQIGLVDSEEMEFTSMEDIELEEEIISNSDLRSSDSEQRSVEVKSSQRQRNISRSRSKRKKKSSTSERRRSKETQRSISIHKKQLVEDVEAELSMAETKQFVDHPQESSSMEVQRDYDDDDDQIKDIKKEEMEVISCSTDKVMNDIAAESDLKQKLQNDPLSPACSNKIMEAESDFIKLFVEEIIDRVVVNMPECLANASYNENISSNQSSESQNVAHKNCQMIKDGIDSTDQENFSETPSPSRIENQRDKIMTDSSSILNETFSSDSNSINPLLGYANIPARNVFASSNPKQKQSPPSNDGSSFQDLESSSPSFSEANPIQRNDNPKNQMVDKSVQVLLSNFKVIRVTQDWNLPIKKSNQNEFTSKDMARQKKELDDRAVKLQALEREYEIKKSFLKKELSILDSKKRAFNVEMMRERHIISRAKDQVDFAWRRIHQKPKQSEENEFVQSTPKSRKRKSGIVIEVTPPPKKISRSRLSKANNDD